MYCTYLCRRHDMFDPPISWVRSEPYAMPCSRERGAWRHGGNLFLFFFFHSSVLISFFDFDRFTGCSVSLLFIGISSLRES